MHIEWHVSHSEFFEQLYILMRIYSNPAPVQKYCWILNLFKKTKSALSRSMWVRFYRSLINMMTEWLARCSTRNHGSPAQIPGTPVAKCTSTGSWSVIPGPELFCWKHNLQNQNYIYFVNKHTVSPDLPQFITDQRHWACVSICSICKWPPPFVFNPAIVLKLRI